MRYEKELMRFRRIHASVFESETLESEPTHLQEERENIEPQGLELMLESELARIRGIGESVFGDHHKPRNRVADERTTFVDVQDYERSGSSVEGR